MERLSKAPSYERKGGSRNISGSSSRSYDYSGFDDHIQRQDALASARDQKKAALYGGNPVQALLSGNRVRELVSLLKRDAPGTTEKDPYQFKTPLSRLSSESSSYSQSSDPGGFSYEGEQEEYRSSPGGEKANNAEQKPPPPAPPPPAPPAPVPPPAPANLTDEELNQGMGAGVNGGDLRPPAEPASDQEEQNIFDDPRFNDSAARFRQRLRNSMYA